MGEIPDVIARGTTDSNVIPTVEVETFLVSGANGTPANSAVYKVKKAFYNLL